jgi:hypothetical protein
MDRRYERLQLVGRVRRHPRPAYQEHESAKADLKKLVPEDAKEATGHGLRAKQNRGSTMRCVTAWMTSIRAPHTMRLAIESGFSRIFVAAPRPSALLCKQPTH